MRAKLAVALTAATATVVLWGAVAGAHVTVSPASLPQGTGDAILTFRVPNESIVASVTGLRVQFPLTPPIVVVTPEAGSGWKSLAAGASARAGMFRRIHCNRRTQDCSAESG